jgi:hypothetical protein
MVKSLIISDETHYRIVERQTELLKLGTRKKINEISEEVINVGLFTIKNKQLIIELMDKIKVDTK